MLWEHIKSCKVTSLHLVSIFGVFGCLVKSPSSLKNYTVTRRRCVPRLSLRNSLSEAWGDLFRKSLPKHWAQLNSLVPNSKHVIAAPSPPTWCTPSFLSFSPLFLLPNICLEAKGCRPLSTLSKIWTPFAQLSWKWPTSRNPRFYQQVPC